jgi:hypothetical protein
VAFRSALPSAKVCQDYKTRNLISRRGAIIATGPNTKLRDAEHAGRGIWVGSYVEP